MKEISVYQALTNSDLTEGRGSTVVIGNFSRKKDAEKVVTGRGVMGSDGTVEKDIIRIFDSVDEYSDLTGNFPRDELKKIKKEALAKLSNREKRVLGID